MNTLTLHHCGMAFQVLDGHEEYTVGRLSGNAIRLHTRDVSRNHCVIRLIAGRWTVRDLGSSNGTHVNGERLVPHTTVYLDNGDTLQIGVYLFNVASEYRAEAA